MKMVQSEVESQKDKYAIGLPIPGFEVDVSSSKNSPSPSIQSPKPFSPKELKATYQESEEDEPAEKEVVDKVFSTKRPSKPFQTTRDHISSFFEVENYTNVRGVVLYGY